MRKIMIMTAALAGFVAASNATISAINYDGGDAYDAGAYELITGLSSNIAYGQSLNGYRGQTISVTNDFELGAITIMYATSGQDVSVSNMAVHVFEVADPLASQYVPVLPASTLFSGSFDAPANTGNDTLYLALGTNISLVAGSYYMILFDDSAASNTHFDWRRSTSAAGDFYPGGLKVNQDGSVEAVRDFALGLGLAPPLTANDDTYILPYGVSSTNYVAPGVLANDLGYDYAVLVTDISSGSLTFSADGSFDCSGLVNGSNTFAYAAVSGSVTSAPATVVVFATLEAEIPIVVDDTFVMDWVYGDHIEGNVLNNDTNTSASLEMFAELDSYTSGNGTLTMSTNDGVFYYTPNVGFTGIDTFTYKAYTVAATSAVATVTLNVEESTAPGTVIDSFENYDNSTEIAVKSIPAAALNWNPNNSGNVQILDRGGNGPGYQYLKVGWDSNRYRGATSIGDLFAGILDSSTEYWLYYELYPTATKIDGCFGVTVNPNHVVATANRGDFDAGVRLAGDGTGTNLDLYAFTGGGVSNDVLLTTGLEVNAWHGIWLNINNAANTYDVYLGEAGDASNRGTLVGSDIAFVGEGDLVALVASSTSSLYVDTIMNVDPESFFINFPAILYGSSPAAFDTLELNIGLNDRANTADYWPVSSDNLVVGGFVPVAHSDAPDGTFAITNLNLASGDQTNKVIYVKATDSVEFFRIENNQ